MFRSWLKTNCSRLKTCLNTDCLKINAVWRLSCRLNNCLLFSKQERSTFDQTRSRNPWAELSARSRWLQEAQARQLPLHYSRTVKIACLTSMQTCSRCFIMYTIYTDSNWYVIFSVWLTTINILSLHKSDIEYNNMLSSHVFANFQITN